MSCWDNRHSPAMWIYIFIYFWFEKLSAEEKGNKQTMEMVLGRSFDLGEKIHDQVGLFTDIKYFENSGGNFELKIIRRV